MLKSTVNYTKTKGSNNPIKFRGIVIELSKDNLYATVRNMIGDLDFIEVSKLTIK